MKRIILFTGFLFPVLAFAQLTGRVVNDLNEAVPFASVTVKTTSTGTVTDSAGRFSFIVNQPVPFILVVSSAGFSPQEFTVRNSNINNILIQLQSLFQRDTVIITSRRRREVLQDVPIPITVLSGAQVEDAGAFNVNRVKEFVPSVQLYTSNPRNTGINIRGLGSPFGLTN
ncbi:MAG: carboxypeptidase-like regulatory domain-containing protein, partial [Ferruginibacter sp.]|nr:carboxypeptidase-like regulatory domain-containing protein [Chitinophagaceae bacterium]